MSRLSGLSQLRHIELLELVDTVVPPGRMTGYARGSVTRRLARLSRDQLIEIIASGQIPGFDGGQPRVAPPGQPEVAPGIPNGESQ